MRKEVRAGKFWYPTLTGFGTGSSPDIIPAFHIVCSSFKRIILVELWTLGRVCALVNAVQCVNLEIHRPVPLGLIIHYMLIKKLKNKQTNKQLMIL